MLFKANYAKQSEPSAHVRSGGGTEYCNFATMLELTELAPNIWHKQPKESLGLAWALSKARCNDLEAKFSKANKAPNSTNRTCTCWRISRSRCKRMGRSTSITPKPPSTNYTNKLATPRQKPGRLTLLSNVRPPANWQSNIMLGNRTT